MLKKKKKSIGKYDPFSREKTKWRPSPRRPIFGINLKGFIINVELCSMVKKKITDFSLKTM